MSKPITKTQLTGFRGATEDFEIDFDHNKDMTILFGENGSGKSSILDAIDVVCCGSKGCLEGVSVGQSPGQYLRALGSQPAALKVTVHSKSETWTGTMQRNAISVVGPDGIPRVNILRRNRILDLVTAEPRQRYEALSRFIDMRVVEQSESNLKQKMDSTNGEINTLTRETDRMVGQLDELWIAEGRPEPGPTAMEWAEQRVNTGIQGLNDRLDRLTEVVDIVTATTTAKTDYETRKEKHANVNGELADVENQIANAPSITSATAVQLLESLEKAKTYIEAEDSLDKCPTCQRPMERDELLGIVNQEFGQLSELKKLTEDRQRIQRLLNTAASHLEEATAKLFEALRKVQEVVEAGDVPELVALNIAWPSWEQSTDDMDALVGICGQIEPVQPTLVQQRDSAQRDVSQFNSIKQWWKSINEANENLTELDRIHDGLKRAYDIVHEKRVAFTQGILDNICQEANRLFQEIHPGENIGLAQLKMKEQQRGSVEQFGTFNGHADIPPQAIFSESHMDTLGFCVWLALAKKEAPEAMILLIDDVFTSLDSQHLNRIVQLLGDESKHFCQVIMATHYRTLRDKYRLGLGASVPIEMVELSSKWSPVTGIRVKKLLPEVDELRQMLQGAFSDRQTVASRTGILLEAVLDQVTMQCACRVARDPHNEPTLGPLLDGASTLLKDKLKVTRNVAAADGTVSSDTVATKDSFRALRDCTYIRNQVGAHHNVAGAGLSDGDVEEFATTTLAFLDVLLCPQCGSLATRMKKDNSGYTCPCKTIEMTPLRA